MRSGAPMYRYMTPSRLMAAVRTAGLVAASAVFTLLMKAFTLILNTAEQACERLCSH